MLRENQPIGGFCATKLTDWRPFHSPVTALLSGPAWRRDSGPGRRASPAAGESIVIWSSPGASSRFEAIASSQVIFLPDSAAMRPRMPVMAALAQRSVSLYGLSWRMASNSRSCSRW